MNESQKPATIVESFTALIGFLFTNPAGVTLVLGIHLAYWAGMQMAHPDPGTADGYKAALALFLLNLGVRK